MGALTLKQYSYVGRPWELKSRKAVDVLDSMLSSLRVDYLGEDLKRILPWYTLDLNQENWITDKIRYGYDSLKKQRLVSPAVLRGGMVFRVSWSRILWNLLGNLDQNSKSISFVLGNLIDLESIFLSKKIFSLMGHRGLKGDSILFRSDYILYVNPAHMRICLLLGTNLRKELPLLYYSLCKSERLKQLKLWYFGTRCNIYKCYGSFLGNSTRALLHLISGRMKESSSISRMLRSMFLVGENVLKVGNLWKSLKLLDWMGYSERLGLKVIKLQIFSVKIMLGEFGLTEAFFGVKESKLLYILGSDVVDRLQRLHGSLVVYQGHHVGSVLKRVDMLLPSRAFLENKGTYISLMGSIKYMDSHMGPVGIWMDWEILNLFHGYLVEFPKKVYLDLCSLREEIWCISLDNYVVNYCGIAQWFKVHKCKIYDFVSSLYELDLLSKSSRWLWNKRRIEKI
jgi:hypothetical protein